MAYVEKKIDVHHHYLPAPMLEALKSGGGPMPNLKSAGPRIPSWSPESSIDYMNGVGARTAILSFPITFAFPREKSPAICRQVNGYAAQVRNNEPRKFGFLAAIPSLLDTEAALSEIRHAFDNLKADGVMLLTRYEDKYLGHPDFVPIWEELNKRSSVVLVHPGTTFASAMINKYVDPSVAEFPHETTTTSLDMIMNNTVRASPNCKIILSHAGGTLPYLLRRATALIPIFAAHIDPPPKPIHEIIEDSKAFYFDLALSSTSYTLDTLLRNFPRDHILYGSDYPFAPTPATTALAKELDEYDMDDETRDMIYWKNAEALFPRLKSC